MDLCKLRTLIDDEKNKYNEQYEQGIINDVSYNIVNELLQSLSNQIFQDEANKAKPSETYTFSFEHSNDTRKGIPYVARLTWDFEKGEFLRHFYNLNRDYGNGCVTVWGDYEVSELDVLDIRTGGSWKND